MQSQTNMISMVILPRINTFEINMRSCTDGLPVPQRYGAILAIALGITVSVLDGAIANVALPTIARDLNASPVPRRGSR